MTSKFKVGDKVVFDELNKEIAKEFGYKPNEAYEIKNVFLLNGTIQLINENGMENAFDENRFLLAEPKQTKNQRITALEETVAKQGEEISELKLIVAQIRKPSTVIEEALTAATSVEDTPKRLTVGDIAKITGNKSPHNLEIGDIVKIVYDDNDHMPYKAERISDGKESLWLDEADLEPYTNDTIEFEGAQYKKVDRVAREGDVVIFHKNTFRHLSNGKPYEVKRFGCKLTVGGEWILYKSDFGRTPETVDVYELIAVDILPVEKSPNEKRAEMIEKAKMFIEKSKNSNGYYSVYDNNDGISFPEIPFHCKVEFIVNEEKRTVIALMRGFQSNRVLAKGIAKCMPGDVFNKYIGMAIALGRALGLDVSEFERAVQPTVAVGQVVKMKSDNNIVKITEIKKNSISDEAIYFGHLWAERNDFTIINDTNAIYGGGE